MSNQEQMILIPMPLPEYRKLIREEINAALDQREPGRKKRFYDFSEACEYLGIAAPTMYKLTSNKLIRFCKSGRKLRFTQEQLDEHLEKSTDK